MVRVLFRPLEPVLETIDHEPPPAPKALRYALPDETPLSAAEILHGMRHGIIWHSDVAPLAAHPAPTRAHLAGLTSADSGVLA